MRVLLFVIATIVSLSSCTMGDGGSGHMPTHPTRKYKVRSTTSGVCHIRSLEKGYSIGDTVDAFPESSTNVMIAVIVDTL